MAGPSSSSAEGRQHQVAKVSLSVETPIRLPLDISYKSLPTLITTRKSGHRFDDAVLPAEDEEDNFPAPLAYVGVDN